MNKNLFYKEKEGSALRSKSEYPKTGRLGFRPSAFAPKHILLAEDNLTNQIVTCELLKRFGFMTDVANNGKEAVAALKARHYDLVLMDIQMPVTNGIQATEIIRHPDSGISCTIPVIAVTANASEHDRTAYLAAGMNDCIPKPVDPALLLGAMERQFAIAAESRDSAHSDTKCGGPQPQSAEKKSMKKIFDKEDLLNRVGGDKTLCKTLTDMFVMTMKEQMEQLKASLDTGDAKQIRFYAHSIKGMTANISATALYETAYQTEIAGEKGEIEKARSLTAELEGLFAAFLSLVSDNEK